MFCSLCIPNITSRANAHTPDSHKNESYLVSWCFKPCQPQRIISGLKETFIRDTVEWTNKAEIRPEEQSEKAESCWENLWNKIQLKAP